MNNKKDFISLILLSGGTGNRMKSTIPKQYLDLFGKPIIKHSLDLFISLENIQEIIVVCEEKYRCFFKNNKKIKFALPGKRRQDSVNNGFEKVNKKASFVCIHDAARPFLQKKDFTELIKEASIHKSATLAVAATSTIKEANYSLLTNKTLDRSNLFEIQTPQIIEYNLLKKGLKYISENNLTVTDDTSITELLGIPTKIVLGSYSNIKITTPYDLKLAKFLYNEIQN